MSGPETVKGFFPHAFLRVPKIMFAKTILFPSWFTYIPAHQLKHSDITFIEKCQNRSRISVFLLWRPTLHTKAHKKIQLLTYSCNVQRAVEVKVLLKSKRESEKKRELDNRHLVHVTIPHNTMKHLS